jgi:hypothetical protein
MPLPAARCAPTSADAYARQELAQGTRLLHDLLVVLSREGMGETAVLVLKECQQQLRQHKQHCFDCILLTLHLLATLTNS